MPKASLATIVKHCDWLLRTADIGDYSGAVNGLQVENSGNVTRIAATVDASLATIKLTINARADLLIVHHGLFWSPSHPWTGKKYELIRLLIENDIAVYSSHLPLDAHAELGNNAQLAKQLGLTIDGALEPGNARGLGNTATLATPVSVEDFTTHIEKMLGRAPQVIAGGPVQIRRIGWCTGAAQGYIEKAIALGLDAYISGEISEPTVHAAREAGADRSA